MYENLGLPSDLIDFGQPSRSNQCFRHFTTDAVDTDESFSYTEYPLQWLTHSRYVDPRWDNRSKPTCCIAVPRRVYGESVTEGLATWLGETILCPWYPPVGVRRSESQDKSWRLAKSQTRIIGNNLVVHSRQPATSFLVMPSQPEVLPDLSDDTICLTHEFILFILLKKNYPEK